jgi:transglutaminase-like putative cysteine protease
MTSAAPIETPRTEIAWAEYRITHTTTFRYPHVVSLSHHLAHMLPRTTPWQTVEKSEVLLSPTPATYQESRDYFGNRYAYFAFEAPHDALSVEALMSVRVRAPERIVPKSTPAWESVRDSLRAPREAETVAAAEFSLESALVDPAQIGDFGKSCFPPGQPVLEGAAALMRQIFKEFTFDSTATDIATPLEEVMRTKRGVCQDFAHLQIACLRRLGLAARYVSGYIRTLPPPGKPRLIGADASHAWVSVFCGSQGWVDLDPTNNVLPATDHITLAWGRDFDDVSPLRGVLLGGMHQGMSVAVDVMPVNA